MVAGAVVVAGGILASLLFERWRVPDVVLLLLAGVVVGPVLGYVDASAFDAVAPTFATLALIVILFEGGLDLRVRHLQKRFGLTTALLVLSYFATAAGVAVATVFLLDWPWGISLLLGFVLAPLSSSIVIPLVARLRVLPGTKALLTVESALGDVLAVLAVTITAAILAGTGASVESVGMSLLASLVVGALAAAVGGVLWLFVLRALEKKPYAYLATFAAAILLFGLTEALGGNGVVAILVFSLVLGNADELSTRSSLFATFRVSDRIKWFHAELSFFVRTFFFLFLGLSVSRSALTLGVMLSALALVAAIVIVRGIVVFALVRRLPEERQDAPYLTLLLGRGLASAALATLPATALAAGAFALEDIAFGVILLSNVAMTAFLLVKERGPGAGADVDATLAGVALAAEALAPEPAAEHVREPAN